MTVCLVLAWTLIYLCVMKGIKSSGKVCAYQRNDIVETTAFSR